MHNPFDQVDARLCNLEALTLEVLQLLRGSISVPVQSQNSKKVYGIAGLAGLLNCSHPTAHRLKASGKIPFTQAGRKLVFDEQAVLSALSKSKNRGTLWTNTAVPHYQMSGVKIRTITEN
jgi:hypothetical protein